MYSFSNLVKCARTLFMTGIITMLVILSFTNPMHAQEKEADKEGAIANGAKGRVKEADRFIYIPYKELSKVYEQVHSSVIINYQEYLDLWKKQFIDQQPAKPPVNATYLSSDYQVKVDNDHASIEVVLKLKSLVKGWTAIPMDFGTAAIGKWTANNDKVILKGMGQGKYQLLLPDAGEYELKLNLGATIHTSLEGREFEWNCPSVSVSTLSVTIPKADQNIEITPKGVPVKTDVKPVEDKGQTSIKVNLSSTEKIKVRFSPKQSTKPEMELLTSVNNLTRVMFRDGMIHTDAYLKYDVLRGKLESVSIAVPLNHRILDVTAETRIKSWKATKEATRQVVNIEFLSAVTQTQKVEIHTEVAMGKDVMDTVGLGEKGETWGIHALNVVRENGQVSLKAHQDLELAIVNQQGVVRIDQNEIDTTLRDPQAVAYKYYSSSVRLGVKIQPVEPKVEVTNDVQITIQDDDIKLNSSLTYLIERAGIFEIKTKLPAGFKVSQVYSDHMKEYRVDAASQTLVVTLLDKTKGTISLKVNGVVAKAKEQKEQEFNLPFLEPLEVARETGKIHLFARESMEIITNEAGIKGVNPVPPSMNDNQQERIRVVASWLISRRPLVIPVKTVRKPTRLSADVGTNVFLKPDVAEVKTHLVYHVEYAGVDTFRFQVPEAYSSRLQVTVDESKSKVNIKQKNPEKEAKDGWVTWQVVLQRETTGDVGFNIAYDISSSGDNKDKNADATILKQYQTKVEPIRPLGLEKDALRSEAVPLTLVNGEISLDKETILSVQSKSLTEDAEAIDIREFDILEAKGFQGFRYSVTSTSKPVVIDILVKRQEIQEVIKTVISKELVEAVIGQDDKVNYRARFQLKTSERQRLPLFLPAGSEPFTVMVGQRQVQLEKAEELKQPGFDAYYISVSRPESSDTQFLITTQFSLKMEKDPFGTISSLLALNLPKLGGLATAVQQERCLIYIPEHYAFIGKPDLFNVESTPLTSLVKGVYGKGQVNISECHQWIGQTGMQLDFPTEGRSYSYLNLGGAEKIKLRAWNFTNATIFFSIAIAVIAMLLLKTPLESKLTLIILTALGLLLFAQADRDLAYHALLAGRFGIMALGFIWVVHTLIPVSNWVHAKNETAMNAVPTAPAVNSGEQNNQNSDVLSVKETSSENSLSTPQEPDKGNEQSS